MRVRFAEPVAGVLERCGSVPLPPYITHTPGAEDAERYQTVYAEQPGAVAAPTAGLHFDREMLKKIQSKGHKHLQKSPCTSAPAPSSRCAPRTSRSTACTASATRFRPETLAGDRRQARARRRHHDAARAGNAGR